MMHSLPTIPHPLTVPIEFALGAWPGDGKVIDRRGDGTVGATFPNQLRIHQAGVELSRRWGIEWTLRAQLIHRGIRTRIVT